VATNFLWGAVGSVYHLLTTELNSLANNSGTALGPEIDNTTNAYQFGRLYLHIASNSLAFTTSSYVDVFLLPSNAGATYPTYTSGASYKLAEANYRIGSISINPATQAANVVEEWLEGVRLPAGKFKCVLVNHAGVTLPASGNTLDLYPTPTQY
jgi:hypothetical protein